ncbi:putative capsid [Linepithema humile rhabdo-like virus 1]|uniref:Capsid n=1 Tax=Linepithema humile rhabdo-like virus 1 TaxID=2259786 RepID=A0AAD0LB61_9MONO|nr:putative capsid [Linepithema humile rhabdo-like virus 1]AXA52566.1 putative capsid [Linepithema humile rhabdo-like virus 1]UXD80057.1 putative capsid protein [Linepithema humile rhabdo-like virus 1]
MFNCNNNLEKLQVTKMIQVVLIILTLTRGISPLRNFNNLELFDKSHFYPNAGIYMEPGGQYISYSGSVTIPFIYSLPTVIIQAGLEGCKDSTTIPDVNRNVLDHIRDVTIHDPLDSSRTKRYLFPIVSVLTGGLSLWNTVEIQGVKNKIDMMENKNDQIIQMINTLKTSQNLEIDQLGQMSVLMSDYSNTIHKLINKTDCIRDQSNRFYTYMTSWLYSAPNEFINAYSGSITGKVTPSLISANNLKKVILNHNDLKETLFKIEPELVYEFGKVILIEINVGNTAYMRGIIQLPKILNFHPLPLYNIHTVNIIRNNIDMMYKMPSILVCMTNHTCWEPDVSQCTRQANRIMCIYGSNTDVNLCVQNLMINKTTGCNVVMRKHINPIVIQTQSGVLIGGSQSNYKVYKRTNNIDIPSNIIRSRENAIMMTKQDGDWIMIDSNIYSTQISGFEYKSSVYITSSNDPYAINENKLDINWKPLNHLSFDQELFSNYNHQKITLIIIITLLIVIIILIVVIYKLLSRPHIKYKYPNQSFLKDEFHGLR